MGSSLVCVLCRCQNRINQGRDSWKEVPIRGMWGDQRETRRAGKEERKVIKRVR
jgi:hypothetical protein